MKRCNKKCPQNNQIGTSNMPDRRLRAIPPKHWALQFRWPDQIPFFASDQEKTADKLKNQKLIILGHQFFIRNKFYKSSY